jgi:hypothetical protein
MIASTTTTNTTTAATTPLSPWVRLRQAYRYTGIGRTRHYMAARGGGLRAVQANQRGDWMTTAAWLDEWMAAGCPIEKE